MAHPKRNRTTFQPGHKRSTESIEKQRRTLQAKGVRPINPWGVSTRAKHALTKRRKALGNTRLANCRGFVYRQVMTMDGYRYEHREVMAQHLDRDLTGDEVVHQINHDTLDNRIDNLELTTRSAHNRLHPDRKPSSGGKLPEGKWARHYDACVECGRSDNRHAAKGLCGACYRKRY